MPNTYDEPNKVRQHNGQQFIDDFKKAKTILVFAYNTENQFEIKKQDLWNFAKVKKVHYSMKYCPFVQPRICLTVI